MSNSILDLTGLTGNQNIGMDAVNDVLSRVPSFSQKPVFVGEALRQAPRFKAIENDLTKECIAIRGKGYALVQHRDVIEATLKAMSYMGLGIESIKPKFVNGKMYCDVMFSKRSISPKVGDVISTGIRCKNSVDGSTGIVISPATFRLACSNGMVHADKLSSVTQWHTGNVSVIISNLKNSIMDAVACVESIERDYTKWGVTPFHVSILESTKPENSPIVEVVKDLPQKFVKRIVEENPTTKYELFNVLTSLNTHDDHRTESVRDNFNGTIERLMAVLQ